MTGATELDVEFVRRQFPGIDDWAFFEAAGGSLLPRTVIDRIGDHLAHNRVQPGAAYPATAQAAEHHELSRRRVADMINASPDEVVFGPSTTLNMFVLSHALKPWFAAGDEVIVTDLDHEANSGAWRRLADVGVVIKEWQVDRDSADLNVADLEALLTERTRLVCFTHCSNVTGSIQDVAAITRLAHDAGAKVCVDAVAYAPHRRLDVKALDVDFYAFSLYKLYGPHMGILYGKREHLLAAKSQNHYFFAEDQIPGKLTLGGFNHDIMCGPAGIIDYFDLVHAHHFPGSNADLHARLGELFGLVAAHEATLAARLVDYLVSKPDVRIIGRATGDPAQRAPTVSFVVDGRSSADVVAGLLPHKVAVRDGHFYAARLIEALGLTEQNGVVRCSMVHYNTTDEVDRLITGLDELL